MTTRTVHTLAYKLLIDTEQFTKGTIASRKEIAHAKREMRSLLSPAEKMELSLQRLGDLAKQDARFQEVYNRKLAQYRKHITGANKDTTLFARTSEMARGKLAGLATGLVGIASAVGARQMMQQIDRAAELSQTSDKLGISLERLTQIQFAASRASGLSSEQTSRALEKMVRRVSEAAQGTGEAQGVLNELGLDAKTLAASNPDQAFIMIARAMDSVTEEHDRLRIATKIFDDEQAGIHTTLKMSNEELERQFQTANRLGRTLSGADASKLVEAKNAMADLNDQFNAFSTQLSVEVAPALSQVLKTITPLINRQNLGFAQSILTGGTVVPGRFGNPTQGKAASTAIDPGNPAAKAFNAGEAAKVANLAGILPGSVMGVTQSMQDREERERTDRAAKRQKMLQEALRLTESVRTAEEKHTVALARIAKFQGVITDETKRRLRAQADARLRGDLISQIRSNTTPSTAVETSSFGPAASIAAGTSEAFRLANQSTVHRTVEVDEAKKQTDLQKLSLDELRKIAAQSESGPKPIPEGTE